MSIFGGAAGPCPCGSGLPYAACCGPLLAAESLAGTPEAVMRSRFTAYVMGDTAHLLRTWHPRTRPKTLDLQGAPRWTELVVDRASGGGPDDDEGVVEFRARFVANGRPGELHEVSRFERRGGRWLYVDGDVD